jgi:hypothetical protein
MKRCIVTNSDSGAGCLKASRIADGVICLGNELASGPAPLTPDPLDFFSARAALLPTDAEDWVKEIDDRTVQAWQHLAGEAQSFDRIELWMDPDPNSQLQLVQLLDWLRGQPEIANKLHLLHANARLGERSPDEVTAWNPDLLPVERKHLELAAIAWRAYRQPSPEPWQALREEDLRPLPYLGEAVVRLLEELPASTTGLMKTQARILELIASGADAPRLVFSDATMIGRNSVFRYWQLGQLLDELAHCGRPAVLGLAEGPFTLDLHDDAIRYEGYKRSSLSLSDFGHALLAAGEDFARHNRIDRWWGGTRLSNERLWRWDSDAMTLVGP